MKWAYWYFRLFSSLVLGIIAGVLGTSILYYVHELGHLIAGTLVQIFINHTFPLPVISNWIWLWNTIPIPQQSKVLGLGKSTIFAFGGPIATIFTGAYVTWRNIEVTK